MGKTRKKGRIKYTLTNWQETFENHPNILKSVSWINCVPEVLHISLSLIDNNFNLVRKELFEIWDRINTENRGKNLFRGVLSDVIELIKKDNNILNYLKDTSFEIPIVQIIKFYNECFHIELDDSVKLNIKLLLKGYDQILERRSDISLLCKYLLSELNLRGKKDPFGHFKFKTRDEILNPENKSVITANWLAVSNALELINYEFCDDIWIFNYISSPFIGSSDSTKREEKRYNNLRIAEMRDEFKKLLDRFKEINLFIYLSRPIAEVLMGFISRISSLSIDVINLVENHRGEIAEATLRMIYESRVKFLWLIKKQDPNLIYRFREYKIGREKLFRDKIKEKANISEDTEEIVNALEGEYQKVLKSEGVDDYYIGTERGDVFEIDLAKMTDDLGEDERMLYDIIYKRTSDIVHGNWRVIEKYHLDRSLNPMHNGLLFYNNNNNKFAGALPAFLALILATDTLLKFLDSHDEIKKNYCSLFNEIINLNKIIREKYMSEYYYKRIDNNRKGA